MNGRWPARTRITDSGRPLTAETIRSPTARAGSDVIDAVEQAVWTRCLDAVGIKSTTGAATLSCAGRADRIVHHVYRQTRKLSRIAIICHSKSALDIHHEGWATLSHGPMTSDDRERRCRPAAGTAAGDVSR
jgi:hypothetical protein